MRLDRRVCPNRFSSTQPQPPLIILVSTNGFVLAAMSRSVSCRLPDMLSHPTTENTPFPNLASFALHAVIYAMVVLTHAPSKLVLSCHHYHLAFLTWHGLSSLQTPPQQEAGQGCQCHSRNGHGHEHGRPSQYSTRPSPPRAKDEPKVQIRPMAAAAWPRPPKLPGRCRCYHRFSGHTPHILSLW
jgi:hypothetical protein